MTRNGDIPKTVASLIWATPNLVVKGGLAYLSMKRMARKSSEHFREGLIRGGMSPEKAQELSGRYAMDISIKKIMGWLGTSREETFKR